MWIDTHNHLQDERLAADLDAVVAAMGAAGIDGCVANGTEPHDWGAVAALARRFPGFVHPSFGLHPWKVRGAAGDWKEKLLERLHEFPGAGVGEIGLDLWIRDADLEAQTAAFRWQWEQAVRLGRPLSVHCLRAWGPLFDQMATLPPHPGRVLVHAFGGSSEVAARLVNAGCYLGFNGYFLQARKAAVAEVFAALPAERILLESDAPDMGPPLELRAHRLGDSNLQHPADLVAAAQGLARLRGLSAGNLSSVLEENFRRWWNGAFGCQVRNPD